MKGNLSSSRSHPETGHERKVLAVLVSGGIESSILLADSVRTHDKVYPLYMRSGHYWENVEFDHLTRFVSALNSPAVSSIVVLEMPMADLYPGHWSITGQGIPDEESDDHKVFLPGRNVFLLSKAMVWCQLSGVGIVALGALATNPFPDATPEFFARFPEVVNQAIGGSVKVDLPYATLSKIEVLRLGWGLPLELTFSCIRPMDGNHCGRCNKCAERRRVFADAGMKDPTLYVL
jgi:7-cyano-7-deazaguanine synthase